jgi:hypothetical protein
MICTLAIGGTVTVGVCALLLAAFFFAARVQDWLHPEPEDDNDDEE